MIPGETFLDSAPFIPPHLWVVCSNEDADGYCVTFNVSTWRKGVDESCILNPGDHPFIERKSFIFYQRGRPFCNQEKVQMERFGVFEAREPFPSEVLKRIQQGALESIYTKKKFQKMVKESM